MKRYGSIYKIVNKVTGKSYVGLTTRTIEQRFSGHKCHALTENRKNYLASTIRKYGINNFTMTELYVAFDREEMRCAESHFILKLNTLAPAGYNLTTGGEYNTLSPIQLKRHPEIRIGKKTGRRSAEARVAISKSLRGRNPSKEHAKKSSDALVRINGSSRKGKKLCPLVIARIVESQTKYRNIVVTSLDGDHIGIYKNVKECSTLLNLDPTAVRRCINRDRMTHKGFKFHIQST